MHPAHRAAATARTEAACLLMGYLFTVGQAPGQCALDARNAAPVARARPAGVRRDGHPCESTWAQGKWTDDLLYVGLGREWR